MKEKSSTLKTIIIIVLICFILGLSCFIICDKFLLKNDNKSTVETKDEESKLPEHNKNYTFINSLSKEIILNKKKHTLLVYDYYEEISREVDIDGIEKNRKKYYFELYFDNKKIIDTTPYSITFGDDISDINEKNFNNYYFLSEEGTDDEKYFAYVYDDISEQPDNCYGTEFYRTLRKMIIINEDGRILDKSRSPYVNNFGYSIIIPTDKIDDYKNRKFQIDSYSKNYYINNHETTYEVYNDVIYYVDYNKTPEKTTCDKLDFVEYKITIKDGVVNKVKNNVYRYPNQLEFIGGEC